MTDIAPASARLRNTMMFVIPSLLGLVCFIAPVYQDGTMSFPLALMAKGFKSLLGKNMMSLVTAVLCFSAIASTLGTLTRPEFLERSRLFKGLFVVSPGWLAVRILGALLAVITHNKLGTEIVWGENTGGLVFNDLLPSLLVTFFLAGLLLPLLLNFGLLEFLGTLLSKVMRPLFRLPGRAAIDCLSSWLGDGTVGVMLTSSQYENKKYTAREASVVATMFSVVGISFSLVVLTQVKLQDNFVPFYFAICLSGVIAAVLLQRIPPLSRKKDLFIDGTVREHDDELIPQGRTAMSYGLQLALERSSKITSLGEVAVQGLRNSLGMVFGVLPAVMAIGTAGLIVAETTPLFSLIGAPFVPLLELLQLPEAAAASEALLIGFTDMYVPSILAASIESEVTRFVIAALSVTQLIFMSETGAVILSSRLPLSFLDLVAIFLLRTFVTLPVIVVVANFVF